MTNKWSKVLMLVAGMGLTACGAEQVETTQAAKTVLPAHILDDGEGEAIAFPIHGTRRLADPHTNMAGMSFFELQVPAGSPGAPPHTHSHEDEFFYVRQGSATFMANGTQKTVSAGGFVLLPRHGLHAFWNTGDEDAILLVGTSKGKFGDFFDAVAIAAREENAQTPQAVGAILGRIGAERGIKIDMSKVPTEVAALYGMPPQ